MATEFLVVSALGRDRIGLVDDVAALVAARGCNVEESRMAVLGGDFALVMLVSGSIEAVTALSGDIPRQADTLGLHATVRTTGAPRAQSGLPYLIESVSLDTPGVLHAVTSVLKQEGVNIEELETETNAAPWTGVPLFVMRIRVTLPPGRAAAALRAALADVAERHDLDIKMEALTPAARE